MSVVWSSISGNSEKKKEDYLDAPLRVFKLSLEDGTHETITAHCYRTNRNEIDFYIYTGAVAYYGYGYIPDTQAIATYASYKSVIEVGKQEELQGKFTKQAKIKEAETLLIDLKKELK
jgi:hypothetical protein